MSKAKLRLASFSSSSVNSLPSSSFAFTTASSICNALISSLSLAIASSCFF
jgi:hypothetical protein